MFGVPAGIPAGPAKERKVPVHILHCTPLGTSMFDSFIRRLQEETDGGRTALLLPSPYLLEAARSRLRRGGPAAWEFPPVLSLEELAERLSGLRRINRMEQELLLAGIVREAAGSAETGYFARIAGFPGFLAALARLFDEFKLAAVTPDELDAAMEALSEEEGRDAGRDRAVAGLFRAYQQRLADAGLMDVGGMYHLAVDALASGRPLPFTRVFMAEFSVLSPLRLELVRRLKQRVPVEIAICFAKDRPGVFRAVEPVFEDLVGMGFEPRFVSPEDAADGIPSPALSHLRRELFRERPAALPAAEGIRIAYCPDRAKELSVAADRIKALLVEEDFRPQDVAVVVNDPDAYSRLGAVFGERGIPVDRAETASVTERALPRLAADWLSMVQERGSRASVLAVLKNPYMRDRLGGDADRLERLLLDEVVRGWEDWPAALRRRIPEDSADAGWLEAWPRVRERAAAWDGPAAWPEWAGRLRGLLEWLEVPAALGRRRRSGVLGLDAVRAELQGLEALTGAAAQLEALDGLADRPGTAVDAGEAAAALRRLLEDVPVLLADRMEGGVQVVTPETASGMNFRAVFVLGLAEGEFPAPPRESWLYSDRERQALAAVGVILRTSRQRAAAADFAFALAAGLATERLTLSALADSETLPSRFVGEVTRLFAPASVAAETFGPHQVIAGRVAETWGRRELVRAAVAQVWRNPDRAAEWDGLYAALEPQLPERLAAKALVEEGRTGAYAGQVDPALLTPSRFSASALESYASCPFRYFVTDVVGLPEWGEAQEGIDAMTSGSVWHEVLAAFLARRRGVRLDPADRGAYVKELGELLRQAVTRRESQARLTPDMWWDFERPRWEKALADWLDGELARQADGGPLPWRLEWAFGMNPRSGCDPDSTADPLVLAGAADEPAVEVQGKVDRIDADDGRYRVVDYKTGKPPARKQVETGLKLQVPLYMLAVDSLLCRAGGQADTGAYLQVGGGSAELVLPGSRTSREDLLAAARQAALGYAAGIRSGSFPAQPAADCPPYCPASGFCRRRTGADTERTGEDADE